MGALCAVAMLCFPADLAAQGAAPALFAHSDRCLACHNGLVTPSGEDVSIGAQWSASMMANAARDPYWQASVRRETLDHPSVAAAIEHECSACHMPMARYEAKVAGREQGVFAHLAPALAPSRVDLVAIDGVSCSTCHSIEPDGLGSAASFTAGFVVAGPGPMPGGLGGGKAYGPFDPAPGRPRIMASASGLTPAKGSQISGSALCGSCHTLITHAFAPDGSVAGRLPEQVPYLEWKHSAYSGERECQDCHLLPVGGETAASSVMPHPRPAVSRHSFRGGNFFMPKILNRWRTELAVEAPSHELDATSRRTLENLREDALDLTIASAALAGGRLEAELVLENRTGHKFPTAYPSRRAWIHFTVVDGGGMVVFESGAFDPSGRIAGNDNDDDPSRFEPHHLKIEDAEDVQIYEPILGGSGGRVTTGLLTAVRYLKDNRLLPVGFDKRTAGEDVAVRGDALADPDFEAGGDRIRYSVDVSGRTGPFSVVVEVLFQPIGFRWAMNLESRPSPEGERFVRYYRAMAELSSARVARAERIVGKGSRASYK